MGERRFERCLADYESRLVRVTVSSFQSTCLMQCCRFGSMVDLLEDIMQASVPKFIVSLMVIFIS